MAISASTDFDHRRAVIPRPGETPGTGTGRNPRPQQVAENQPDGRRADTHRAGPNTQAFDPAEPGDDMRRACRQLKKGGNALFEQAHFLAEAV